MNTYTVKLVDTNSLGFTFKKEGSRYSCNALENECFRDEYIVTIEKDEKGWMFYAEEHEPSELVAMGFVNYLSTLKAAKIQAVEFSQYFQETQWTNQRDNDPID
jgi:hypothetical protein